MIPWNETKFKKANVALGLEYDEICPGLTVNDHAESIAMFQLHGLPTDNLEYSIALEVAYQKIRNGLYAGFEG